MDQKRFEDRMSKFTSGCTQLGLLPEVLFARGEMNGRKTLLMMAGPTFTLESLKAFRDEVIEILDAKENQLKGKPPGPGTAHLYHK